MKKFEILFVDDNPVNLIAAENLMLSVGLQIDKAYNGERAIELVARKEYDLIFMDLLMPKMDGIMTTQVLRGKFGNDIKTKIIATSGIEVKDFLDGSNISLFDGNIQKPLNLNQLKYYLELWLGKDYLLQVSADFKDSQSIEQWNHFIDVIKEIKEIEISYILEFNKKDIDYFVRLMKSSMKQIYQAIKIMENTIVNQEDQLAHEQLHALKSVLYYVGAHKLAKVAQNIDALLVSEKEKQNRRQKFVDNMPSYQLFIEELVVFSNELEQAMNAYNSSIKSNHEVSISGNLTDEELSKKIEQILFYLARYEYIEILNGLNNLLILVAQDIKPYILQAISALEEFDYEKVEVLLRNCWDEAIKR